MKNVNCFLVQGNENLSASRKDCETFISKMKKENLQKRSLMLVNRSPTAALESFPGQMDKERDRANLAVGGVENLIKALHSTS